MGLAPLAWGDSAHQLGAIVQRLLAVERTLDSREREGWTLKGLNHDEAHVPPPPSYYFQLWGHPGVV